MKTIVIFHVSHYLIIVTLKKLKNMGMQNSVLDVRMK